MGEVDLLLRRALVEDPRFTYAQVGRLEGGVSRQAIEKQAKGRGWRVAACRDGQRDAARTPAWERPSPADLRHVRELHALGMGAPEAMDLLGYGGVHPTTAQSRAGRLGGPRVPGRQWGEHSWRGWRLVVEREVAKLIAADALRAGATLAEAAEVSGLRPGSISAWVTMGKLPRSVRSRGERRLGWKRPSGD